MSECGRLASLPRLVRGLSAVLAFLSIAALIRESNAKSNTKSIFKISVFYDESEERSQDLVSYSIDAINRQLHNSTFQFEYSIAQVVKSDGYNLTKKLCNELNDGRIAILVIGYSELFAHLRAIASSLNIPVLSVRWEEMTSFSDGYDDWPVPSSPGDRRQKSGADQHESPSSGSSSNRLHYSASNSNNNAVSSMIGSSSSSSSNNLIVMHPPSFKLMIAICDLIDHYKWKFVTILYQDSTGIGRIKQLLSIRYLNQNSIRLQLRKLDVDVDKWMHLLKDVKLSASSHLIIDVETKYFQYFLDQAEEVGLMTTYYHLIVTSSDLSVLDYSPSSNISALQIYTPNNALVQNLYAEFNLKSMISKKPLFKYMPSTGLFIYDAFSLLAHVIEQNNLARVLSASASCSAERPWLLGNAFVKFLKMANFQGLTGHVEFEQSTGYRRNLTLNIVDKTRNGIDLVGYWREGRSDKDPTKPSIQIVRSYAKEKDQVLDKLNRHLKVTAKLDAPYVMLKEGATDKYQGNDKYMGYCVDLLEKISDMCGFNYTIKLVDDGLHGAFVDGKWNGIVSELIDKKADLAVAALTINYQREQVIDFTIPFLNLGISILYKRPLKKSPNMFSFLSPFSNQVWLYIIAAYLLVSFMLFILARFSPYEWVNPHPCNPNIGHVENQFSLLNSLWFTIGSLMQQGTEIAPGKSPSVRFISAIWAFFTLIIISSYNANLAAFLTVQRMQTPIENVEDLSKQTEIKYGPVKSGSTETFFKESKIQTYERMWNFMSSNPSVFVKSTEEGIARVKSGGYAYLLESTTNEYSRQGDCELMQVGGLLDSKGYGIGTPTGSPWRDQISNAILQLQEKGDLHELYNKWWKKSSDQSCDAYDDKKKDSTSELSFESVSGIFIFLLAGLGLAFIVAILEFLWKAKKADSKTSIGSKLVRDFKFALLTNSVSRRRPFSSFKSSKSAKQREQPAGVGELLVADTSADDEAKDASLLSSGGGIKNAADGIHICGVGGDDAGRSGAGGGGGKKAMRPFFREGRKFSLPRPLDDIVRVDKDEQPVMLVHRCTEHRDRHANYQHQPKNQHKPQPQQQQQQQLKSRPLHGASSSQQQQQQHRAVDFDQNPARIVVDLSPRRKKQHNNKHRSSSKPNINYDNDYGDYEYGVDVGGGGDDYDETGGGGGGGDEAEIKSHSLDRNAIRQMVHLGDVAAAASKSHEMLTPLATPRHSLAIYDMPPPAKTLAAAAAAAFPRRHSEQPPQVRH